MQVIGLLLIVLIAVKYFWWIAAGVGAYWLYGWVQEQVEAQQEQERLRRLQNAVIARRADQQHAWVLAGDERGLWGCASADMVLYDKVAKSPPREEVLNDSPARADHPE